MSPLKKSILPPKPPQTRARAIVGIDPGVHTGVAVVDHGQLDRANRPAFSVATTDFWGVIELLAELLTRYQANQVLVVIEHAKLNRSTYVRHAGHTSAVMEKISRNVGANHAHAELLAAYCERKGLRLSLIRPTDAKWTAATFTAVTGYTKACSEHARDAARLVFGL